MIPSRNVHIRVQHGDKGESIPGKYVLFQVLYLIQATSTSREEMINKVSTVRT